MTRGLAGMRRPSWNKSQAIQQVISLKALLESGDDSGAGALRKVLVSHSPTTRPKNVVQVSVQSGYELLLLLLAQLISYARC